MWAHDYCTVCDKQCAPGSMYCSDSCRLTEHDSSSKVSPSDDDVYSMLYTTGRHHSLSSPEPFKPSYSSHLLTSPDLLASPALTVSSAISIDSLEQRQLVNTPPLSPVLSPLSMQPHGFNTTVSTTTSVNYKRWLSSPVSPVSPKRIL